MTDLNPCPSCREPLDHPSGDGCANMAAHKERAVGDDHLVWQLRNSKGWPTLGKAAAARIEALTKERDELQVVVDKQGALLADAYGADLDWEEVLKQRADHEAVKRNEALTEQLTAARQDAKEAEAYAEELEKGLNTCRMAQVVMDNTVAGLEGKLAKAMGALEAFAEFDALPTAVKRPDLFEIKVRKPILRTLAEIKGESQDGMV